MAPGHPGLHPVLLTICLLGLLSHAYASTAQRALKQLQPCSVANCQTCVTGQATQCSTCYQGFLRSSTNQCSACATAGQTRTACSTFTANTCTCTSCNANFGPQPNTRGQCLACVAPTNCTTPQPNVCNGCSVCARNFGLTGQTCTACTVANCQTYTTNTCTCTACNTNFNLTGGTCAACNVPANCATPMANRCQGCSVCQKGFFPTGPTNNRQCAACSDGQALGVCTAYSSAGTSCVCTACADGWRLEQGTCVQCPANPNCDSYKANTCDCATCKANFSGNTCAPCPVPASCTTPMANRCQGCSVCQSGFLPSGTSRQCSACTGGQAAGVCATYSSTGTSCACTTCANRYRLDKGSCTECTNNPNCETFRPNSSDCATCKANSTGPSCVACPVPANCATPMANRCQGCSVCQSGFALTNRQCTACTGGQAPGVCTAYSSAGTSCVCTACAAGWRLDKGTCVKCTSNPSCKDFKASSCDCDTCNIGFRGLTCAACTAPLNCNTTRPNVCHGCSVCRRGFAQNNGQCSACTGGQAPSVCTTYSSTGTSCECTACADGWRLEGGTCIKCATVANCDDYAPNSCDCATCKPGFRGPACAQCPAPTNCTKAQTNVCDGCAVCQRGLAPALTGDNRGQCAACTGGQATAVCNAYTNLGTSCACATCNNRYQLVLGSCAECTNNPNCETFRSNSCDCSICRVGHTGLNCAECIAPTNCTTPMDNKCDGCSVCLSGFAPAPSTRQCLACTGGQAPGVCTAYNSTGTSCSCTACAAGWRLDKGTCVRCPSNPNCDSYKPNTCECTACKPGFRGPTCAACPAPANCTTEMGNRCQGCSVCQAGFSLSDSQCAACTGGQALDVCTTYGGDNSCECTSCANGYRLEEGACVECKMLNPNCKDFKANSCDCATCEAGYSGDNCELCAVPDSCMTALDDACQGCAVCHSGFAVADKQCTACTGGQAPEACAAYADAGTSCECATCPDGWQLAQGACTECAADPTCTAFKANSCDCDTCASGHYLTVDNKCGKCPDPPRCATAAANVCDGCDVCEAGNSLDEATRQCTLCTDGQAQDVCAAYTADNTCDCARCINSWQLDGATCVPCQDVPNCQTYGDSSCDCAQCNPGYTGGSCEACASGYKRNGDACEVCDGQGCDTFADGSCTCAVCLTGYALDAESGACRQCPENQACEAYEPNSCNCVTCTSGSAGPLCMPCNMDNCARFEDGSCLCAECAPGNQLTAWKQCLACEPNPHCTEPQPNSCDCTACEAGYTTPRCAPECDNGHAKSKSACIECTGNPGCEVYEDNSCTCRDCMAGYFINSETGMCEECNPRPDCTALVPNTCDCQPCQLDNCEAPLEGCSGCSQCASGYTLPAGSSKCEQCQTPATNCEKFKPNSCSECVTCASGYTLDEAASACNKDPGPTCLNGFYPKPDGSGGCIACEPAQPACSEFQPNTCVCAKCKQDGFAAPSCNTCDDGWQPKDENICERCTAIEHCKSYDSTCACATCDAGYSGPACQPEAAGQCATEPPGCAEAEAGNCERCAVCANTHQLDWYVGTCSQCPENPRCETLYQNTCGCAKCRDGYVGWMCEACANGWKPDVRGGCEQCQNKPAGCFYLEADQCERCWLCESNHRRDDESGTCGQCVDNPRCLATYWNSCNCYQCAEGYAGENCDNCANGWRRTDSGCERCPEVPNCQGYDESCACTSCAPGFSGPDCKPCRLPDNCAWPADWSNLCSGCGQCADGYFINFAKQCEACQEPLPKKCYRAQPDSCTRCATCWPPFAPNPETGACDKCANGLVPTNVGSCQQCDLIPNCQTYDVFCGCSECAPGHGWDPATNQCQFCSTEGCGWFGSADPGRCTPCWGCDTGYYLDGDTQFCKRCPTLPNGCKYTDWNSCECQWYNCNGQWQYKTPCS